MIIKRLFRKLIRKFITKLGVLIYEANGAIANETLPKFGNNPKNLVIDLPRRIVNPEYMFLGDHVYIGPGSLLLANRGYPFPPMQHPEKKEINQWFNPKIIIGNRVTATGNLQIGALSEISIEDDVMFASNVQITDGFHGYENANEPYKYQKMFRIAPIRVKRGCWIGQNVVILPGVTIGELTIIGANSVVTKNIPDRCIAVGSPAKVIKTWDENTQRWVSVENIE
ncbi:putative galactoside O-acetyltransferase [Candidatus Kuenenia stuttgartiensis]|nr:acyltransferase [Candidatus Kuenenia stuttgartiensis]QII12843.1 putative galactoside O-acetyltransferase [Candidatus Kuenenia stuttgartiensis]